MKPAWNCCMQQIYNATATKPNTSAGQFTAGDWEHVWTGGDWEQVSCVLVDRNTDLQTVSSVY